MATWRDSVTAGWARAGRRTGWSRVALRLGQPRAGARLCWRAVVAGLALTLIAMPTGASAEHPVRVARTAAGPSCGRAVGPFSVQGTHVVGQGGKVFVSYGLTVPGLQATNWDDTVALDRQKIRAAADDWCANTVRLQLSQDNLVGTTGTSFDRPYLKAIESEVSLAEHYHLVVVLNDETNFVPQTVRNSQLGPTPGTATFWKDLAQAYGNDPQVIFDLFNEPRTFSLGMSQAQEWRLWLNGGRFQGVTYPFGMAQLAEYVRYTVGARNLFWIEGPRYSLSFAGMVRQGALLPVSGVVYSIHHSASAHDPAAWYADFGYLIADGIAPVVDGEWTNYEPPPSAVKPSGLPGYCWTDAPTTVPEYLRYLYAHGVGLSAYQLQPGILIQSYASMGDPTAINPRTWTCQSNAELQPGQGAGSAIMAWFKQHNS